MSSIFLSTLPPTMIAPALVRASVRALARALQCRGALAWWGKQVYTDSHRTSRFRKEGEGLRYFREGGRRTQDVVSLVIRAIRIRASAMREDLADTSLDVFDQGERIELLELFGLFLFLFSRNVRREHDPLGGCQRLVMFALDLLADASLFDLLHRRNEIVQQEPKRPAILSPAMMPCCPRPHSVHCSVHPVAMSTRFIV